MTPVPIPGNKDLCLTIHAEETDMPLPTSVKGYEAVNNSGLRCLVMGWKPSAKDLEAIKAGGLVYVQVNNPHPTRITTIGVFTCDEKGERNI